MILFIVLEIACSFIFSITLPVYLKGTFDVSTIFVLENALTLILSLGLACGFIKLYTNPMEEKKKVLTGFQKFEIIFIGIALDVLIQFFLNWLLPKIGSSEGIIENIGLVPQKTVGGITIFILGMALVPAIFEELLFRKWILNPSKKYGTCFAVVFSALLFGLYHLNVNQGIFAFLLGIIFGIIAIKTGTIKYTVLLHFLNNSYACLGMILGEDSIGFKFLFNTVIAIAIVGGVLILKNLPNLRKVRKEDLKIHKDTKYLLRNYTFVVSMILIIVMFIATEHMLH